MSLSRTSPSIVGRRLRARREQLGWSLERVGVAIGIDESTARTRISRYELGVHQPPEETALLLAKVLGVPHAYLHCESDRLAEIILATCELPVSDQEQMLRSLRERLALKQASAPRK
jgi:transcriptional regulator with XRE-family HTH domain